MKKIINQAGLLSVGILTIMNLTAAAASKPKILLIMADDQAKHALGCYGNKNIQTPGLDRLVGKSLPERIGVRIDRYKLIHYPVEPASLM